MKEKKTTSADSSPSRSNVWIWLIISALAVWSLIIAIGTLWRPDGAKVTGVDLRRPMIVLVVMTTFIGVWVMALRSRTRKN